MYRTLVVTSDFQVSSSSVKYNPSGGGSGGSAAVASGVVDEMNGHTSSLERRHQYYYNVVTPPRQGHHHREPSGLDLAHRADQRGSAFELYKKPTEPNHYLEHGLRYIIYHSKIN